MSLAVIDPLAPALTDPSRALWVKERITRINKEVSSRAIANGLLLKEAKDNAYHAEWGFGSFEEAIEHLHKTGELDYGVRNAWNFIAVIEMAIALKIDMAEIEKIPISKLREICTIPDQAAQTKLLEASSEMTVSEVQKEAKALRHKAKGYDTDPLNPITLMMTDTMKEFFNTCIERAKTIYPESAQWQSVQVLVDCILPEWFSSTDELERVAIEGELVGEPEYVADKDINE